MYLRTFITKHCKISEDFYNAIEYTFDLNKRHIEGVIWLKGNIKIEIKAYKDNIKITNNYYGKKVADKNVTPYSECTLRIYTKEVIFLFEPKTFSIAIGKTQDDTEDFNFVLKYEDIKAFIINLYWYNRSTMKTIEDKFTNLDPLYSILKEYLNY